MTRKQTVRTHQRPPAQTRSRLVGRNTTRHTRASSWSGDVGLRRADIARQTISRERVGGRSYVGVLPSDASDRVRNVLQGFDLILDLCAPHEIRGYLDAVVHAVVVFDPAQFGPHDLRALVGWLRERRRAVVVYVALTATGIQDAVWIARETGAGVVFQSRDEDPLRLARTLLFANPPTDAATLLAQLGPSLTQLPMALRIAVEAAFGPEADLESPKSLALRAGVSRRSLDRWLARVGISSVRRLARAPAMLHTFRLLCDTSMPMDVIANVTGLQSTRRLRACTVEFTGRTPRDLRAQPPSATVLIDRMTSALTAACS